MSGTSERSKITDSQNQRGKVVHHGQTPAAWVGTIVALVAFILGGLALVLQNWPMFWVSVGLLVVALIATKALQLAGHGAD